MQRVALLYCIGIPAKSGKIRRVASTTLDLHIYECTFKDLSDEEIKVNSRCSVVCNLKRKEHDEANGILKSENI